MRLSLLVTAAMTARALVAPATRRRAPVRAADEGAAEAEAEEKRPAKISMSGLRDLMALGVGAPNLGTFTGVDEETGTMNFELDENRFISKNGKEYGSFDNSKGTYFEAGEVDEDADFMGKLMGLFGGGEK